MFCRQAMDAPNLNCQESSDALFQYVNCAKSSEPGEIFHFGLLMGKSDSLDQLLLRSQCTLVHSWLELVKGFSLARMQKKAPQVLKSLAAVNNVKWLRTGCRVHIPMF